MFIVGENMKWNLEKIQKIYGESIISELKENIEDVIDNMSYLKEKGFTNLSDLVESMPYLFLNPTDIFQEKIDYLEEKWGIEFIEKLEEDFSLWEEIANE